MKKYDIALFDLDGTISESGEGILDCVRMIFEEMNRPLPDEQSLAAFIGPPMYDSLKRCGFNHEEADKGVAIYKKNFVQHGIYKNRVYDGLTEVLPQLRAEGLRLGVATTKYQKFADKIIAMLGLNEWFDVVGGSNALAGHAPENGEPPRTNKVEVMQYVIRTLKQSDKDRIVMLGDTKYDAEGAAAVGCDFIGCLYGYGTEQEMRKAYPIGNIRFVKTPRELPLLLM